MKESSAPRGDAVDLGNVYSDLAAALGAAHHQSTSGDGSPERLAAVNQAVQQLWSRTVQRLGAGMEHADLSDIPPVVEPDLEAPADLDVDAILDHVAGFEPAPAVTPPQSWSPFGWAVSVRTAALVWCAVAAVLAVVLGLTVAGPVVVPAFIPPIATGLLLAWRGVGRAPGVLWAIGLAPLVFLVVDTNTSTAAALAFVTLVEGFAYLTYLSGSADGSSQLEARAQRRPLEIELVLYSLAAWTIRVDMAGLLVVACLAGLLWRRRWTAVTAAGVTGLALFVELSPWSTASADLADTLVYAVLTAHWVRAIFHGPWLASRLSVTEIGLALSGRALRGSWRVAQRTVDNALPPLVSPGRNGLFQGSGSGGQTFSQPCPTCSGRTPHTDGGTCLSCWKKGR